MKGKFQKMLEGILSAASVKMQHPAKLKIMHKPFLYGMIVTEEHERIVCMSGKCETAEEASEKLLKHMAKGCGMQTIEELQLRAALEFG